MSVISQNWGEISVYKKMLSCFKLIDKWKSFLKHESSTKVIVESSGHNKCGSAVTEYGQDTEKVWYKKMLCEYHSWN